MCVFGRAGELKKEQVCVFIDVHVLAERIWHQKLGRLLQNALFDRIWHPLQGGGVLPRPPSFPGAEPCLVPVASVPGSGQDHRQLPPALPCAPGTARTAEPIFSILPCQNGSGGYSVKFNMDRWRTSSFVGSSLLQGK